MNVVERPDGDNERVDHATQKPVECMRRPFMNHTSPGDAVYDPFLGSGTTIIAAESTGRIGIGIELNPAFAATCLDRFVKFGLAPYLEPAEELKTSRKKAKSA